MKKGLICFILIFCMLFSNIYCVFCYAEQKNGAYVEGSYRIIATLSESLKGAKVTFYGEDGGRYIVDAYEIGAVGKYRAYLPEGVYNVEVSRKGYLKNTLENVWVYNKDIILDHGSLTAGDLNSDGKVNIEDIMISRRDFDSLVPLIDLSGNGIADETDINTVSENFNMKSKIENHNNTTELLCDYREDPMGIDYKNPYLSWKLSSYVRGQKQTGIRLVVSSSRENIENGIYDMWDVSSDDIVNGINYGGKELEARKKYFWTVFISDKDGNVIAPSKIATFETGLFGDFGENNKWISSGKHEFNGTVGTLEANLTLESRAVGLNFCHAADNSSYLMWQINVFSGDVRLRTHRNKNGAFSVIEEVSLSKIFPNVSDIEGKPFDIKLSVNDGTVVTYINGLEVNTYTNKEFVGRIGGVELRVASSEKGTINRWAVYDKNGELIKETSDDLTYSAPMFRKSFNTETSKTIEKARLYATSAGSHEMYLNGVRCSDDYLAPGKSEYSQVLYYQTYDVTDKICAGENTLAGLLGIGWYNGGPIGSNYGTNIALKAKLIITYTDGTEQVIDTDGTWVSNDSHITANRLYIGQHIDGRKYKEGWNENGLNVSEWPYVKTATERQEKKLLGENTVPIRVIRTAHPVEVTSPEENVFVYRFPTNMSGTARITAEAERGTRIHIKYSEMLTPAGYADVTPYIVNAAIGDQNGEDEYIFAGKGRETFEFNFVYHGFQYMEIRGLSEPLEFEDITALVLSTDNERTGYFESSNPLLNQYYENVIRSQQSNSIGALTDNPTREKNNWTGDGQGFCYTANYNYNAYNIYRSFSEMISHAQSVEGIVPEVVPIGNFRASTNSKSPSGWSDAVIMIPWQIYFQYGDKAILTENYDEMKKWADYLIRTCSDDGYIRLEGWYGEHVSIDRRPANAENYPQIGTAFSAYSIGILSKICGILGNAEDEAYYKAESEKFAKAWRDNYLLEDGYTNVVDSQTFYAMGIYYDLYETEEKRRLAADKLDEIIRSGNATLGIQPDVQTVGILGYPIFFYTLSRFGHADTAFKVLERTEYPSLLYPVTLGATTVWEYYNKSNSLNQYIQGAPAAWLYSDILGISHDYISGNEGYRHFVLRPTYGGRLTYAKGSYNSINGIIESSWELSEDNTVFTYSCTVPAGTTATLMLPIKSENAVITEGGNSITDSDGISFVGFEDGRAVYEITSGKYIFEVKEEKV